MTERTAALQASIGFHTAIASRRANEDFAGAVLNTALPEPRLDVIAAIADGIGGAKGGRVAAETAVRGFLDGMSDLPETAEVRRSAARVLDALNSWMYAESRRDHGLAGMGCTFTGLVLRRRTAYVFHLGDTRAYRWSADRLHRLTTDHIRSAAASRTGTLYRALGVEAEARVDYIEQPMARHDRFLLCSDGLHGSLPDEGIAEILGDRSAPAGTARALVESALRAGSSDNCTALVVDVLDLPTAQSAYPGEAIMQLPIVPVPQGGETIDGFVLRAQLSDGRYSRLFGAVDEVERGEVALKFPKPRVAEVQAYRAAFIREAWVGARVSNPGLGRIIELPQGRQTCLYSVMPLYQGELLEARLARRPSLGLEEGRNIALRLARAAAALHREGIIHRDIKPDNVILEAKGSLKLIDLGAVRVRGQEDSASTQIPGTRAYVAAEMFAGEAGNEATDLYALGVTMFRAFTGEFPYGNADATAPPGRTRPFELTALRPDLPAWLQAALARAIATDPADRYRDMTEFAAEIEAGPTRAPMMTRREPTLYERAPIRFWQALAGLLALIILLLMLRR